MQNEEQDLIAGLRAGEEKAYQALFRLHYQPMCLLALSILHDDFLAQAAVSDVISHIYEVREEINVRTSLHSYLLTCTRNHCLNLLGTKVNRSEQTFSALQENEVRNILDGSDRVTPQGQLLDNELLSLMRECIDTLPEPTRTTFIRSRFEGMSYREIAAECGVSANTIKVRIQNALRVIEQRFAKYLTLLAIILTLFISQ